jgi:hypothetical protein
LPIYALMDVRVHVASPAEAAREHEIVVSPPAPPRLVGELAAVVTDFCRRLSHPSLRYRLAAAGALGTFRFDSWFAAAWKETWTIASLEAGCLCLDTPVEVRVVPELSRADFVMCASGWAAQVRSCLARRWLALPADTAVAALFDALLDRFTLPSVTPDAA